MTGKTITVGITECKGGGLWLSGEALALLFGVPLDPRTNAADIPDAITKQGRRRIREAYAAIGRADLRGALEYWAAKDHNADVEFDIVGRN